MHDATALPAEFLVEASKQDILGNFHFWVWVLKLLEPDMSCTGHGIIYTLWDRNGLSDGTLHSSNPYIALQRLVCFEKS